MTVLHNQINKLWYKPSYLNFKKSSFVKQVFTSAESDDFIRTGAHLIKQAEKLSNTHIPWDESRRLEILSNPRLENAFVSLGTEYLFKGIFLLKGYSINKLVATNGQKISHPVKLKGNKSKLNQGEVFEMAYITTHLPSIVDFVDFDKVQQADEAKAKLADKGERLDGITRMTIPYPNSKQMLDYLLFKRNFSLHRPFIIPEFRGITKHIFSFLNYTAQSATGKSLDILAELTDKL